MNITKIEFYKGNNGKIKANGVVTFENFLRIKFTIITGKNGDFLTWKGTEKGTDGKFYSPITFVNKEDSDKVTKQILDKLLAESHSGSSKPATSNFSSDDIPF